MITYKQEKFAENISDVIIFTSAYRDSYDTQNMSQKTVCEEPSSLRKRPKVAARIMELEVEKRLGGACRRSLERIGFSKN